MIPIRFYGISHQFLHQISFQFTQFLAKIRAFREAFLESILQTCFLRAADSLFVSFLRIIFHLLDNGFHLLTILTTKGFESQQFYCRTSDENSPSKWIVVFLQTPDLQSALLRRQTSHRSSPKDRTSPVNASRTRKKNATVTWMSEKKTEKHSKITNINSINQAIDSVSVTYHHDPTATSWYDGTATVTCLSIKLRPFDHSINWSIEWAVSGTRPLYPPIDWLIIHWFPSFHCQS